MSLPAADEKRRFVERMFDDIAPRYDLVNRVMTFGIDRAWRRRAVRSLGVGPGAHVLDLGCGTGDLLGEIARTGASAVGADISFEMMAFGRKRFPKAAFCRADAQCLPFADATFDAAISAFALRNFASIDAALTEMARVVKPGGRLAILEVNVPDSSWRRSLFELHFKRIVPRIGRVLSNGYAYEYLAASTVYLPRFEAFREQLARVGFVEAKQQLLLAGAAQLITARRCSESRPASPESATPAHA